MKKILYILLLIPIFTFSNTDQKYIQIVNTFNIMDNILNNSINNQAKIYDDYSIYTDYLINIDNNKKLDYTSLTNGISVGYEFNNSRKYSYGINGIYLYNYMKYNNKATKHNNNTIAISNYWQIKNRKVDYNFVYNIGYSNDRYDDNYNHLLFSTINMQIDFNSLIFIPYVGVDIDAIMIPYLYSKAKMYIGTKANINLGKFHLLAYGQLGFNTINAKYNNVDIEFGTSAYVRPSSKVKLLIEYISKNLSNNTIKIGINYMI